MRHAGPRAEADEPGLPASSVTMLRLLVAWSLIGIGLLDLVAGIDGLPYLIFHVVLLGGGLALLALGLVGLRPKRPAYLTGVGVAALGLLVSSLPSTSDAICCRAGTGRHGFPFTLLASDGFDPGHAIADLLFWACVGLFALLAVARPAPRRQPAHGEVERHAHSEQRAEIADDENVGGLP